MAWEFPRANDLTVLWGLFLLFCLAGPDSLASAGVPEDIRAMTGRRTRVVWSQDQSIDQNDSLGNGVSHLLMGLDTDDGVGARAILPTISGYTKPLLTHDGSRVVFTNRVENETYVVNWDGTGLRRLVSGFATDVWVDPDTKVEWVYVRTGFRKPIRRYQIDATSVNELVWNLTEVGTGMHDGTHNLVWFQVSPDGLRAAGDFPMNHAGIAVLPNDSWSFRGNGCWPNIAPDDSYRMFHFKINTLHRVVSLYNTDGTLLHQVLVGGAPGIGDTQHAWHPRWSNHVRFLTITGPYPDRPHLGGGTDVEIYIGKFSPDLSAIEQWIQISHNHNADYWGDAWIGDPQPSLSLQPSVLAFAVREDEGDPPPRPVQVQNSGDGILRDVSTLVNYSGASGWLSIQRSGGGNRQRLENTVAIGGLAVGDHSAEVQVSCLDAVNSPASYTVQLTVLPAVDDVDPTIDIDVPEDGSTVGWLLVVEGTASDDVSLERVEVRVDAGPFEVADGLAAWTYLLDTTALSDGPHTITAVVTDASGNTGSQGISVQVDNSSPPKPSIEILSPRGGEVWYPGTVQNILWTTVNISAVVLLYSTDNGQNWKSIKNVDDNMPEWGDFPWEVPDEPSDQCLVRIEGYLGETPTQLDLPFEIRALSESGAGDERIVITGSCTSGQPARAPPWLVILAAVIVFIRVRLSDPHFW